MSYIKKNQLTFIAMAIVLTISVSSAQKSVGIGTDSPDPSAVLDISAEYMGVLIPRLSESQITMITSPATGLLVYQTDENSGFYFYDGTSWTRLSDTPSELEKINTGWRLLGRDPNNHGTPGVNAVDLSYSNSESTTKGATGHRSTALGFNTTASGLESVTMGRNTIASNWGSIATGEHTTAKGSYSVSLGRFTNARAFSSVVLGRYNDTIAGSSIDTWVPTDPLFSIGIGSNSANRQNAMMVRKDGKVSIGHSNPHASALLDIQSTSTGMLPPRMTEAQRDDITDPAEGLLISCNDCSSPGLHQYINGSWQAMMQSNQTGDYGTVVNPATGKVWLDRNLGASQVATASDDEDSYGDLYQWGRNADGHQRRDLNIPAQTTDQQANNFFTTHGNFIIGNSNWLDPAETHMWSGTAAENNPCPSGFRIPTAAEWEQERRTWSSNNAAGAFDSLLRLPLAGIRHNSNGSLFNVGTGGYYWSSTVSSAHSRLLGFNSSDAGMNASNRAFGISVRCLKD